MAVSQQHVVPSYDGAALCPPAASVPTPRQDSEWYTSDEDYDGTPRAAHPPLGRTFSTGSLRAILSFTVNQLEATAMQVRLPPPRPLP